MLNDADLWPVTCAECGNVFQKEIGWLKHAVSITCPKCGRDLAFRNDTFAGIVEDAKKTVEYVARSNSGLLTEKKS